MSPLSGLGYGYCMMGDPAGDWGRGGSHQDRIIHHHISSYTGIYSYPRGIDGDGSVQSGGVRVYDCNPPEIVAQSLISVTLAEKVQQ